MPCGDWRKISNNKSVNVPQVKLDIPFLRENDVRDLLFGIENDFDFVAASRLHVAPRHFVHKEILEENGGGDIRIIAKIENFEGIENIDEIFKGERRCGWLRAAIWALRFRLKKFRRCKK